MYLVVESSVMSAPKSERPLQHRSEKGIVDRQLDSGSVRDLRDGGDVGQLQRGIRRRLDEHQPGVGLDRAGDCSRVRGVDKRGFDLKVRQYLLKQPDRSAIHHVGDDHVIARFQNRQKQGRDGSHAGSETHRGRRILQRAQGCFQGRHCGISGAGVSETLVNADRFLMISGGLVDGGEDSAGSGIG